MCKMALNGVASAVPKFRLSSSRRKNRKKIDEIFITEFREINNARRWAEIWGSLDTKFFVDEEILCFTRSLCKSRKQKKKIPKNEERV